MYLIAIAWLYVVVLMAVVEAASPQGSLLGAFFTLLLYGALPLGLLLFIAGTPARRRMRHRAEAEAQQAPAPPPPNAP
jgi:chorismate-pyruvate lyase